jgi:hypothetical protein
MRVGRLKPDVMMRQSVFFVSVGLYVLLVFTTELSPVEISYSLLILGSIPMVSKIKDLFGKS